MAGPKVLQDLLSHSHKFTGIPRKKICGARVVYVSYEAAMFDDLVYSLV